MLVTDTCPVSSVSGQRHGNYTEPEEGHTLLLCTSTGPTALLRRYVQDCDVESRSRPLPLVEVDSIKVPAGGWPEGSGFQFC